ncbi:MAG: hypothetical protein A3G24_11515 [Betaproteobacteria bacterium RIFCSPLOWO2_12_FULL_62_13]|nr:MAG: hypothetical protein A3G24_11515 [Betaproteobacteria bacterium RIFCSPLOWO2_12_FULL_62_13]
MATCNHIHPIAGRRRSQSGFVNQVKVELEIKAMFREVAETGGRTPCGNQGALTGVILARKATR